MESNSTNLKEYIQWSVKSGASSNVINSIDHSLVLLKSGLLCKTKTLLVWKGEKKHFFFCSNFQFYKRLTILNTLGMYDNVPVALKITWDDGISFIKDEMAIYDKLNATRDSNIESHRVPRIYYYSESILGSDRYTGIAMTLFQETLNDRLQATKKTYLEL